MWDTVTLPWPGAVDRERPKRPGPKRRLYRRGNGDARTKSAKFGAGAGVASGAAYAVDCGGPGTRGTTRDFVPPRRDSHGAVGPSRICVGFGRRLGAGLPPSPGTRDLRLEEGRRATVAREMLASGD